MMISAMYPKESVDQIIWALDAAIDYDIVQPEESELLRDFITSLSNLKKEEGIVICKPGDYAKMVEGMGDN